MMQFSRHTMKPILRKLLVILVTSALSLALVSALGILGVYVYLNPKLPSVAILKDVRLQVPLRVYTSGGELIAEFGEVKRIPLSYDQIPHRMIEAILAAEDDRFFEHSGVSFRGLLRAAIHLVLTGRRTQGGSTITMQVARNFFLSRAKTYLRKINEIFLSYKIENELTKKEILELYLNKIYLGNGAYGIGAAAQVYYGKNIHALDLSQYAMIAGLPKAPSSFNPIADYPRAIERRNYVLGRMHDLGEITDTQYHKALAEHDVSSLHKQAVQVAAPYVAEMVRAAMIARFGNQAYTNGYRVYTTLVASRQRTATHALRSDLLNYATQHGYRGPERHTDPLNIDGPGEWDTLLGDIPVIGGLPPAVVIAVNARSVYAYVKGDQVVEIPWQGLVWARRYIDDNHRGPVPQQASDILSPGDLIRVHETKPGCWSLAEVPKVAGALVSLRPSDGAVEALVGGFDYYQSKFNRVIQAKRQTGSSFKPFIYAAALDKGFTAASIINDAPVVFDDPRLEDTWRPENYSGHFFGPTRLRVALIHSRNLASIRLLRAIGIGYAVRYVQRFGFVPAQLPRNLSLALGSGAVTPLELARGYAVFANGGYRVEPYYIDRVYGPNGHLILRSNPLRVCGTCLTPQNGGTAGPGSAVPPIPPGTLPEISTALVPVNTLATAANASVLPAGIGELEPPVQLRVPNSDTGAAPAPLSINPAPRVLSPQTAYLMTTMMRDVIRKGTGRAALVLDRNDLAGKTGTTNHQRDAWFSGFNADLVTTAWVGFDTPGPLGRYETGARAALPMWISYMRQALKNTPEKPLIQPPGMVVVRIDAKTGLPARVGDPDAIFETFRVGHVPLAPPHNASDVRNKPGEHSTDTNTIPDQLF